MEEAPKSYNTSSHWQVGLGVAAIIITLSAGFLTFYASVAGQEAGVSKDVSNLQTQVAVLNNQVGAASDRINTLRENAASMKALVTEIETQFCSADQTRNMMHAFDLRLLAMLWQKVNNATLPTDNAYYPTICRRDAGGDPSFKGEGASAPP